MPGMGAESFRYRKDIVRGGHMRRITLLPTIALALAFSTVITGNPALADKPSKPGGKGAGKQKTTQEQVHDQRVSGEKHGPDWKGGRYFSERNRIFIRNYYGDRFRSGHCPPGLAKKGNGCMPPGQAKKWMIGRPLPRGVVLYDLPPAVLLQLGPVPSRHRYVRVASDILMIAVGTGMVVDAIEDIGR
jgi:hypothetical protein